jgi:RimJ/RimL family protein N-acetyltransferase
MNIRLANELDLPWIAGELHAFAEAVGLARLFDASYAPSGLRHLMTHHVLLIAEREGARLGMMGGLVTPHLMNPSVRVLCETFWWVSPQHRGTSAGLRLLNAFLDWGKSHVDMVTMTLECNSPVREETLFKRDFKLQERSYVMVN